MEQNYNLGTAQTGALVYISVHMWEMLGLCVGVSSMSLPSIASCHTSLFLTIECIIARKTDELIHKNGRQSILSTINSYIKVYCSYHIQIFEGLNFCRF